LECLLIVSQYYFSRHHFIVGREENAIRLYENCRSLIEKLEDYKRKDKSRPYCYGDICPECFGALRHQRNVNDSGDIYFIPCGSISKAVYEMKYYQDCSHRESQGYQKEATIAAIAEHHNAQTVREIVEQFFEIL
jgi:hypothetical protein